MRENLTCKNLTCKNLICENKSINTYIYTSINIIPNQ